MSRLTFLLLSLLLLCAGCSKSPEYHAYAKFKAIVGTDEALALRHFAALREQEKIAVYFGANEIHPPDTRVTSLVSSQTFEFLSTLRSKVLERNDYVTTFDYVINVGIAKRNNRITDTQFRGLNLAELCTATGKESNTCLDLLDDAR